MLLIEMGLPQYVHLPEASSQCPSFSPASGLDRNGQQLPGPRAEMRGPRDNVSGLETSFTGRNEYHGSKTLDCFVRGLIIKGSHGLETVRCHSKPSRQHKVLYVVSAETGDRSPYIIISDTKRKYEIE